MGLRATLPTFTDISTDRELACGLRTQHQKIKGNKSHTRITRDEAETSEHRAMGNRILPECPGIPDQTGRKRWKCQPGLFSPRS